jgi:mannosyltransferase OCH1-like enzyme
MINVFQVFITDNNSPLPDLFKESTRTVKENLKHTNYHLFNHEECKDLIRENFPKEVFNSFLKLNPYAYKHDLAHYCLGYLRGGWLVDISIKIKLKLDMGRYPRVEFLGFRDYGATGAINPRTLNYPIASSLFYTKPNSKIMGKAIDIIVENCKNEYYGPTASCQTGPSVLGRAQAQIGTSKNHELGFFMPLTYHFKQKNRSYILPIGDIFAIHKDTWFPDASSGDISAFGAKGTNNYLQFYSNQTIYNSEIVI